jgi:hypothetical protein
VTVAIGMMRGDAFPARYAHHPDYEDRHGEFDWNQCVRSPGENLTLPVWGKNRFTDVCDPFPAYQLAQPRRGWT